MSRCLTFRLAILVALAFAASVAHAAAEKPQVYWYSAPVMAGQVAAVQGEGWGEGATVGLAHLPDGAPGEPGGRVAVEGPLPAVKPLQVNPRSVKFVVPPGSSRASSPAGWTWAGRSDRFYLNRAAAAMVAAGGLGSGSVPGGMDSGIRTLPESGRGHGGAGSGRATGATPQAQAGGLVVPHRRDPGPTAPGEYTVWVHNGKGGPAGWAKVGASNSSRTASPIRTGSST